MLPYALRQTYFFRDVFSGGAADEALAFEGRPIAEIREDFHKVWASSQLDTLLALGRWLHREGELGRAEAIRFSRALNTMGAHEQALGILSHEHYATTRSGQYWRSLAAALAGVGQLRHAADALARAQAIGGDDSPSKASFADALLRARQSTWGGEPVSSWAAAAELISAYLVLDLPARAAEALGAALDSLSPGSDEELIETLVSAQDILRYAAPDLAGEFAASMRGRLRRLGLLRGEPAIAASAPQTATDPPAAPAAQLFLALADAREGRHGAAAARLGPLTSRFAGEAARGAETAQLDLARSVGRMVIDEVKPTFDAGGPRKIVDMFCFSDEFTLLRIKLEEMYDWVDWFVIVEAPVTFRGDPKPLHFAQCREQFARFADKIVHVIAEPTSDCLNTAWSREFYQRDCGLRALAELCGDDDLVLISDVDEVVDRRAVRSFSGPFATLGMRFYSYFFNLERIEAPQSRWAAMVRARYLRQVGASYARFGLPYYAKGHALDDAGWHFSKVRSAEGLARKFGSNSNLVRAAVDQDTLSKTISRIRIDGGLEGYIRRDLDDSFPAYIRRNADALREFIL